MAQTCPEGRELSHSRLLLWPAPGSRTNRSHRRLAPCERLREERILTALELMPNKAAAPAARHG
jgi:hypothetical protein